MNLPFCMPHPARPKPVSVEKPVTIPFPASIYGQIQVFFSGVFLEVLVQVAVVAWASNAVVPAVDSAGSIPLLEMVQGLEMSGQETDIPYRERR